MVLVATVIGRAAAPLDATVPLTALETVTQLRIQDLGSLCAWLEVLENVCEWHDQTWQLVRRQPKT